MQDKICAFLTIYFLNKLCIIELRNRMISTFHNVGKETLFVTKMLRNVQ